MGTWVEAANPLIWRLHSGDNQCPMNDLELLRLANGNRKIGLHYEDDELNFTWFMKYAVDTVRYSNSTEWQSL